TPYIDADFDFAFVSHAPMETNSAVADVRADRAEIWSGLKSPIVAQQTIAAALGLPVDKVTVHVVQAGGSFGRRLFFDAALEAALVSKACGRPVRL
ncbi:molybdopterin cofactor-binding domain-containing protein, partial [Amycolatopsis magusensis]